MMGTAILIPVLGRPHRVRPLVENIELVTPEPHTLFFAASDEPTVLAVDELLFAMPGRVAVIVDEGDTWPNRINMLYSIARARGPFEYVFTAADDLLFHAGWLGEAQASLSTLPDGSGIAVVNDLHNPAGTMALITVDYIERFGGTADGTPGVVMHPGYLHNWSDTELIAVARARGRCARAQTSVVEHLHHETGQLPFDETYALGMKHELQDRALFMERRRLIERPA